MMISEADIFCDKIRKTNYRYEERKGIDPKEESRYTCDKNEVGILKSVRFEFLCIEEEYK